MKLFRVFNKKTGAEITPDVLVDSNFNFYKFNSKSHLPKYVLLDKRKYFIQWDNSNLVRGDGNYESFKKTKND